MLTAFLFACGSQVDTKAAFTVSPAEALVGAVITFNATGSSGAITSFEWDFGDGTYGSGQVVNHAYASAKVFTVTLTVRDSDGGTKTSSSTVDIYRNGKKIVITKTYPGGSGPAIWIDRVLSENSADDTAAIVIREGGFYPDYLSKSFTFWVNLPDDLLEYQGFRLADRISNEYQAAVSNLSPRFFFLINSSISPCIGANGDMLIIDVKIKNLGSGTIDIVDTFRHECHTDKKKDVPGYSAALEITSAKIYD